MKTQINNFRSGTKFQTLNPAVNYSDFPRASSHTGHSGSNTENAAPAWEKVVAENPESLHAIINGIELTLVANWSLSRKTVTYTASITNDQARTFGVAPSKKEESYVAIHSATQITVSNGKKCNMSVCPSLVTIL